MKKLTVGLALLISGLTTNAIAALPTGVSRCTANVPSLHGGFSFGADGLFWRPSAPELDYALAYPDFDIDGSLLYQDGSYRDATENKYNRGIKANVGYIFPCTGNEFHLTYTHWDNRDSDSLRDFAFLFPGVSSLFYPAGTFNTIVSNTVSFNLLGEVGGVEFAAFVPAGVLSFPIVISPGDITAATAHAEFNDRTWDLDFAQNVNFGHRMRLRWFGGLRYSSVEHILDATYEAEAQSTISPLEAPITLVFGVGVAPPVFGNVTLEFDVSSQLQDIINQRTEFQGVGPRFGFDVSYFLGGGFGITGGLSAALLVGKNDAQLKESVVVNSLAEIIPGADVVFTPPPVLDVGVVTNTDPEVIPLEVYSDLTTFQYDSEMRVVPNLDANIGIDWTYQLCNCSRTQIKLELGYWLSYYFDALDRLSAIGADNPAARSRHVTDVQFEGPYFGVQVNL